MKIYGMLFALLSSQEEEMRSLIVDRQRLNEDLGVRLHRFNDLDFCDCF